jgi:GT2 family glycosyltransferase
MISVVIPTRNRNELLKKSLEAIILNEITFNSILIIDSSDNQHFVNLEYLHPRIRHLRTNMKSAAKQRNIGIDEINSNEKYLAFLDDDIVIPKNYFLNLIETIKKTDCVGVSGIALNPETLGKNKKSLFQILLSRFFLLSSKKEGKVLRSGVNTPVDQNHEEIFEVEWLIGCSVWNYPKIRKLKFREDFEGQSLGEDVIFSQKARKYGKIYVNSEVILTHLESPIMRPSDEEFMYMWVKNRLEIVKEKRNSFINLLAFNWCNLGKILQILLLRKRNKGKSLRGIMNAYIDILFR